MQLIVAILIAGFLFFAGDLKSQIRNKSLSVPADSSEGDTEKIEMAVFEYPNWQAVDIDFLSSYYEQDGNNSPVTGGIGTEQLTDFTQKIIMSIPVNPRTTINADGGYDYYTSASTDMIEPAYSDDSAEDLRVHGNVGITRKLDPRQTIGFRLGGSVEYDYWSAQAGVNYSRLSKNENTSLSIQGQTFIDYWTLIYPVELRGQGQLVPTNARQSFNGSIGVSQVLDKKTQVSINLEGTYMNGLLSTPFHRVYFQEQGLPKVENLPTSRFKVPIGLRLNRYLTDWLVARMYYRFYWDSWGMMGHTASIELPIKITRFLSVAPSYRFHTQTAVDYYLPFKMHTSASQFYTSDTDLSALQSHAFGLGVNYQPAGGIFKANLPGKKGVTRDKRKHLYMKNLDLKYSHYQRSTGLNANIISLGIGFSIY